MTGEVLGDLNLAWPNVPLPHAHPMVRGREAIGGLCYRMTN